MKTAYFVNYKDKTYLLSSGKYHSLPFFSKKVNDFEQFKTSIIDSSLQYSHPFLTVDSILSKEYSIDSLPKKYAEIITH